MVSTPLYLGIDFGTSGARAMVIDDQGNVRSQARFDFATAPSPRLDQLWLTALHALIQALPLSQRQGLVAIALNGTSSTVLFCDRNGEPLTPPLLYNDQRGLEYLPSLQPWVPENHSTLSATSSLAKLWWWRQQPDWPATRYLLHQADWLALQLHGQLGISDYHNSLKLGYDVVHQQYPDWLLNSELALVLPKVQPPGVAIAPILPDWSQRYQIPPACQICAGTTDSIAAFLASGADKPGMAVTSLGSTLVLKLLSHHPVEQPATGVYSHRLGNLWLVGGASNTGGAVLQQFFSTADLVTLSGQIPTDQPSPYQYYPLTQPGERFPINDPNLQPQLEPRPHDPVAFLHGLLESMARIEAQGYRALMDLGATPLTQIYTAGGGAKNPALAKIRERHLNVSCQSASHTEAAYGSAHLAQQGLQSFSSKNEAKNFTMSRLTHSVM